MKYKSAAEKARQKELDGVFRNAEKRIRNPTPEDLRLFEQYVNEAAALLKRLDEIPEGYNFELPSFRIGAVYQISPGN